MTTSKQNLTNVLRRGDEILMLNDDIADFDDWVQAETKRGGVIRPHTMQYRDQLVARRMELLDQLDTYGGDVHRIMR